MLTGDEQYKSTSLPTNATTLSRLKSVWPSPIGVELVVKVSDAPRCGCGSDFTSLVVVSFCGDDSSGVVRDTMVSFCGIEDTACVRAADKDVLTSSCAIVFQTVTDKRIASFRLHAAITYEMCLLKA